MSIYYLTLLILFWLNQSVLIVVKIWLQNCLRWIFQRLSPNYLLQIIILTAICVACFRYFFGHQLNKYSTPSNQELNSYYWGFTVDWLNNQIYFCESRSVMAYDMSSDNSSQLYTTDSECRDLAVDPYTR